MGEFASEQFALPYDTFKSPDLRYRHGSCPLHFEPATQQLLEESGRRQAIATAAVLALLHRYTQQQSVGISFVSESGALQRLSLSIEVETSAAQLVAHVETLLDEARAVASSPTPLSRRQVVVDFSASATLVPAADATVDRQAAELGFQFEPAGAGGRIDYDASLFEPATIERVVGHLMTLVSAFFSTPNEHVIRLQLLTVQETRQLLSEWRPESIAYPRTPVFRAISQHANSRPNAVAVEFNGTTLSYAELEARANRIAQYLNHCGAGRKTRVIVCVEPSLHVAVAMLGVFKSGAAYVPLDVSYPPERQATILEDTQPLVILCQSNVCKSLPATRARIVELDTFFDADSNTAVDPLVSGIREICNEEIRLEDAAFVVYTSGTTGKPKGVVLSHGNLLNYMMVAKDRYGFDCLHVQPVLARTSFSISLFELLLPLVSGGTAIVLERSHVLDFRRLLETFERSTVIHASPSLLRKLLAHMRREGVDAARFDGLKHVSSGGDLVAADLMESLKGVFRKAELFVIYGCSEVACMGCTFEVLRQETMTRNRVGGPFHNVIVRTYDAHRNLVPVGVVGEVYFGGAGLASGYLNAPELTDERFVLIDGERFYRTGDVGRLDRFGNLEILGRSDFQVKLRGIRIELGEIEAHLRGCPGISDCVVVMRAINGEDALVAYVVTTATGVEAIRSTRRLLQRKLPDYMVPSTFVSLERLPVNVNQKLDRQALPMPTAADLSQLRTLVAPRDDLERQLTNAWKRVLNTDAVGIEDNFFDVGGTSLMALSLMIEIERTVGKSLPLTVLLTHPTVAELARMLREPDGHRETVVRLNQGTGNTALYLVHDGEGELMPYRELALALEGSHSVYGIQPLSRGDYPMLHSRLSDVVDFYTHAVLRVQPEGPYLLGGLCIGGFIAFEMARRLKALGHTVSMVALIDAAHVQARHKSLTVARFNRLNESLKGDPSQPSFRNAGHVVHLLARKVANVVTYELSSRERRLRDELRMRLFRAFLDRQIGLPKFLRNISVRIVLRFAEKEYVTLEPYDGEVLLFRATKKRPVFDNTPIDDTPYIELFEEEDLGWKDKTMREVLLCDVPAGHSSMLQDPWVSSIASLIRSYIPAGQRKDDFSTEQRMQG